MVWYGMVLYHTRLLKNYEIWHARVYVTYLGCGPWTVCCKRDVRSLRRIAQHDGQRHVVGSAAHWQLCR